VASTPPQIRVTTHGSRGVVHVSGDLDWQGAEDLHAKLTALSECMNVDVELGDVTHIDPSAVRALTRAYTQMRTTGGRLRVTQAAPPVMRTFERMGLASVLVDDNPPED
jgi:anti-anti-sigma factor